MNRLALEALDVRPGERVLEVGFGGGELLSRLLAARAQVTGIDPSEAMLARARLRFVRALREDRLTLRLGTAERLPLPNSSVDKACSVNAIYFWPDLNVALRELARVLRPGGALVLCFQTVEAVRRWPGHRHGFSAYEPKEVVEAMARAGLTLAEERRGRDAPVGDFVCLKGVNADG
jgi:arsenite methyltransferase